MKRYYILLLGLCMMSSIQAQDNDPRKAFDRFAQRSKQKFDDFRSRANEQYAEAMKRAWERFNAQPAVPRPKDETVPPVVLPEEDRDKPIETRPVPIKDVVTPPAPAPQPEPISPVEERPQPKDQTVGFVYCGTKLEVRMNASSRPRLSSCDNDALAAAWSRLAKDDALNNTLRDCLDLRQELQLCDWAYLNMIHALAQKAFGESNEATLLTAYLYCQSGYQMRLARNSERVVLLFASNHAIYNSGYYRLENTNFYPFGGEEPLLEICDAQFPKAAHVAPHPTRTAVGTATFHAEDADVETLRRHQRDDEREQEHDRLLRQLPDLGGQRQLHDALGNVWQHATRRPGEGRALPRPAGQDSGRRRAGGGQQTAQLGADGLRV